MNIRGKVLRAILVVSALTLASNVQSQPKAVRVGVFAGGGSGFHAGIEPFRRRLHELGYIEGDNLALEVRNAEGKRERYAALAADLARQNVDVIVVQGNAALVALRRETPSTPIVMAMIGDPVGAGFVASLARPGGNITGLSNQAEGIGGKWVELLKEVAPQTKDIGVLWDPNNVAHAKMWGAIRDAGRAMSLTASTWDARGPEAIARAYSSMVAEKIGAVIILPDPTFGANLKQVADLAARHRIATIYGFREFPLAGGLMSYGPSIADNWRRAAEYVDRIARGAKPADLPVSQPLIFELTVNRKAADAIGLALPPAFLLRAAHVIE